MHPLTCNPELLTNRLPDGSRQQAPRRSSPDVKRTAAPARRGLAGLVVACCMAMPSFAQTADAPTTPARIGYSSDHFAQLFPSRVKTVVKAGYDPDDRAFALSQGNDDGFSGLNLTEAYRDFQQGNPLSVLAHFEGRPGVMGMFFRNFWSDYAGMPHYVGENNRTSIWLDGQMAYDQPLQDFFRNQADPRGQVAPFSGPLTGNRAGGHVTHTQIRWQDSFKIGLWDDGYHNASRFHRVAAVIGTPEGELPVASLADWSRIAKERGAWPHRAPRQPITRRLVLPAAGRRAIQLTGPAAVLELTAVTQSHLDYQDLWARFSWDGEAVPSVHVPLRTLGGMMRPPQSFPVEGLLYSNDGDRQVTTFMPMPFRRSASLEIENRGSRTITLDLTYAVQSGNYPEPWGYFTVAHHVGLTGTGEPFLGPQLRGARGMLRGIMLEDAVDDTGRIADMHMTHLEGDLCVRINGNRGDDHTFAASETSIGRWGWYITPADRPFVQDTSFQSSIHFRALPGGYSEGRRIMGSLFAFDPIHFVDGIELLLEHGVQNTSNADYALTTFLYVQPGAARRSVAEIDFGNPLSELQHNVQYTQWTQYTRTGAFFRDQFFGTAPVTDTVRHIKDYLRFQVVRPVSLHRHRPMAVGFRLDRLGGSHSKFCQADVLVDGQPAGLLHCYTHSGVYPWKEGGELEIELPRALTDGKASFTVEVRPRAGTDALRAARAWVYEYVR